jgi:hypothetical protein
MSSSSSRSRSSSQRGESNDSMNALKSFYSRRKYSTFAQEHGENHNNNNNPRSSKRRRKALNDTTNTSSYEYKFNEDDMNYTTNNNSNLIFNHHGNNSMCFDNNNNLTQSFNNNNNNRRNHNNNRKTTSYECKYNDDDDDEEMVNRGMPLITPRYNNPHVRQQRMEQQVCTAPRKQRKSYEENVVPETARLLLNNDNNRYSNHPNSAKNICAQLRIAQMEMNTVMEDDED